MEFPEHFSPASKVNEMAVFGSLTPSQGRAPAECPQEAWDHTWQRALVPKGLQSSPWHSDDCQFPLQVIQHYKHYLDVKIQAWSAAPRRTVTASGPVCIKLWTSWLDSSDSFVGFQVYGTKHYWLVLNMRSPGPAAAITRESVGKAASESQPETYWTRICILTRSPRWLICIWKCEGHIYSIKQRAAHPP